MFVSPYIGCSVVGWHGDQVHLTGCFVELLCSVIYNYTCVYVCCQAVGLYCLPVDNASHMVYTRMHVHMYGLLCSCMCCCHHVCMCMTGGVWCAVGG